MERGSVSWWRFFCLASCWCDERLGEIELIEGEERIRCRGAWKPRQQIVAQLNRNVCEKYYIMILLTTDTADK